MLDLKLPHIINYKNVSQSQTNMSCSLAQFMGLFLHVMLDLRMALNILKVLDVSVGCSSFIKLEIWATLRVDLIPSFGFILGIQ